MSLQDLCVEKLKYTPLKELREELNWICYNKVLNSHLKDDFQDWKANFHLVALDMAVRNGIIEDIYGEGTIEAGEYFYDIWVKRKDMEGYEIFSAGDLEYSTFIDYLKIIEKN